MYITNNWKRILIFPLIFALLFSTLPLSQFEVHAESVTSSSLDSNIIISEEGITIDGVFYSQEEFKNLLEGAVKLNSNDTSLNTNTSVTMSSVALPAGEWYIVGLGTVTITLAGAIYIQGMLVDATSWVIDAIMSFFADSYEDAKESGTETENHSETHARQLPTTGDEYSSKDRIHDGKVVQRRYYGKGGKPEVDIDYTDHGNPKAHPKVPHRHDWINGVRSTDWY